LLEDFRRQLKARAMPVAELAKSETLSQNPDAYERWVAEGGKPRRASAEAALKMDPRPRMGDRITYYVTLWTPGGTNDWQRARPIASFDPQQAPYDPQYYLKKLDDWIERYGGFLGIKPAEEQGELLLDGGGR
jgi:DNA polymerase I